MATLRPRSRSRCPRLEAVSPFPREEATPPVTKMCLLGPLVPDVRCTDFKLTGCPAGLRTGPREVDGFEWRRRPGWAAGLHVDGRVYAGQQSPPGDRSDARELPPE